MINGSSLRNNTLRCDAESSVEFVGSLVLNEGPASASADRVDLNSAVSGHHDASNFGAVRVLTVLSSESETCENVDSATLKEFQLTSNGEEKAAANNILSLADDFSVDTEAEANNICALEKSSVVQDTEAMANNIGASRKRSTPDVDFYPPWFHSEKELRSMNYARKNGCISVPVFCRTRYKNTFVSPTAPSKLNALFNFVKYETLTQLVDAFVLFELGLSFCKDPAHELSRFIAGSKIDVLPTGKIISLSKVNYERRAMSVWFYRLSKVIVTPRNLLRKHGAAIRYTCKRWQVLPRCTRVKGLPVYGTHTTEIAPASDQCYFNSADVLPVFHQFNFDELVEDADDPPEVACSGLQDKLFTLASYINRPGLIIRGIGAKLMDELLIAAAMPTSIDIASNILLRIIGETKAKCLLLVKSSFSAIAGSAAFVVTTVTLVLAGVASALYKLYHAFPSLGILRGIYAMLGLELPASSEVAVEHQTFGSPDSLAEFLALVVGVVFSSIAPGPWHIKARSFFSSMRPLKDLTSFLTENLKKLMSFVYFMYTGDAFAEVEDLPSRITNCVVECSEIIRELATAPRPYNDGFLSRLVTCETKLIALRAEIRQARFDRSDALIINELYRDLEHGISFAKGVLGSTKGRTVPFSLLLQGEPGEGKTTVMDVLPSKVYARIQEMYERREIPRHLRVFQEGKWSPTMLLGLNWSSIEDNRFEGYRNQWCVNFAEIFVQREPEMIARDCTRVLSLVDSGTYCPPMAFDLKGIQTFTSDLLLFTTNADMSKIFHEQNKMTDMSAIFRRFHACYTVSRDKTKTGDDAYLFTVDPTWNAVMRKFSTQEGCVDFPTLTMGQLIDAIALNIFTRKHGTSVSSQMHSTPVRAMIERTLSFDSVAEVRQYYMSEWPTHETSEPFEGVEDLLKGALSEMGLNPYVHLPENPSLEDVQRLYDESGHDISIVILKPFEFLGKEDAKVRLIVQETASGLLTGFFAWRSAEVEHQGFFTDTFASCTRYFRRAPPVVVDEEATYLLDSFPNLRDKLDRTYTRWLQWLKKREKPWKNNYFDYGSAALYVTGTLLIMIPIVTAIVRYVCPGYQEVELESSKKNAPQVDSARQVNKSKKFFEEVFHQVGETAMVKICKSVYAIKLVLDSGNSVYSHAYSIAPRMMLINAHMLSAETRVEYVELKQHGSSGIARYSWFELRVHRLPAGDDRDLVAVEFPPHALFHCRKLKNHFPLAIDRTSVVNLQVSRAYSRSVAQNILAVDFLHVGMANTCQSVLKGFNTGHMATGHCVVYGIPGDTSAGDCMLPYVSNVRGAPVIEGFHTARGTSGAVYYVPLYREDFLYFRQLANPAILMTPDPEYVVLHDSGSDFPTPEMGCVIPPGTAFVGTVANRQSPYGATSLRPSNLNFCRNKGVLLPPLFPCAKVPAKLMKFEREGQIIDPLEMAYTKFALLDTPAPLQYMDRARQRPVRHFAPFFGLVDIGPYFTDPEELTWSQCLYGDDRYDALDMTTADGYRLRVMNIKKCDILPGTDAEKIVFQELDRLDNAFRRGRGFYPLNEDKLKDELRDLERVRAGKTRLFNVTDFFDQVIARKYTGWAVRQIKMIGASSVSKVGITPGAFEWAQVTNSFGNQVVAGDIAANDMTIANRQSEVVLSFFRMLTGWNLASPPGRALECVVRGCASALHLVNGFVYQALGGNSSGNYLTTVYNTVSNFDQHRCIFKFLKRKFGGEYKFRSHVHLILYSDDNQSQSVAPWWTIPNVALGFKSLYGMNYTMPDKSEVDIDTLSLTDSTFLSRAFVPCDPSRAPLDLSSIYGMLLYYKKSSHLSVRESCLARVDCAFRELAHHPRALYDDARNKVLRRWQLAGCMQDIPTWEAAQERRLVSFSC